MGDKIVAWPDTDLIVVGAAVEVFAGDDEREDVGGVAFEGGDALVVDGGGGWRWLLGVVEEVVGGGGGERRDGLEAALRGERGGGGGGGGGVEVAAAVGVGVGVGERVVFFLTGVA